MTPEEMDAEIPATIKADDYVKDFQKRFEEDSECLEYNICPRCGEAVTWEFMIHAGTLKQYTCTSGDPFHVFVRGLI